jgi:hypothetical protein
MKKYYAVSFSVPLFMMLVIDVSRRAQNKDNRC